MSYPKSLSDAWVESCCRLYDLCEKYGIDTEKATVWDAFKLLYLESVPDLKSGRKSKGVIDVFTD